VNTSVLQSTLREVRAFLTSRSALVAMLAAGLVLGLSGPFDTLAAIPNFLARSAYWIAVVCTTMVIGTAANNFVMLYWPERKSYWLSILGAALLAGLLIALWLGVLNYLLFDIYPNTLNSVVTNLGIAVLIAIIVSVSINISQQPSTPQAQKSPAILERLPFEKRGALIALAVSDHYVEVRTTKGAELVLMRLSDAIRETDPVAGLQTHRSYWVAQSQIKAARREGDRAILTMSNGQEIPVSRSNITSLKDAGLLS